MPVTAGRFAGLSDVGPDMAAKLMMPTHDHEVVDSSASNATPVMENSRLVYVDVTGIIKFDYVNDLTGATQTEIMTLNAGAPLPFRNVSRVYRYYTGTSACTAQVFKADGTLTVGLKLRR